MHSFLFEFSLLFNQTLLVVVACILEISSAQESPTSKLLQRQRLLASRRAKLLQERLDREGGSSDTEDSTDTSSAAPPRRVVQRKRVKTSRKVVVRTTTSAPTTAEPTTTEAPTTTTEFTFVPEVAADDFSVFPESEEEFEREPVESGETSQEDEDFLQPERFAEENVEPEEPIRTRVVVPVRRTKPIVVPRRRTQVATPAPVEEELVEEPVTRSPKVSRPRVKSPLRQQAVTSRPTRPSTSAPFIETIRRYSFEGEDGSFTFGYENADGSFKEETRGADCIVRGKYGYIDPDGEKREFTYESGNRCDPNERDSEEEDDDFDNSAEVNTPRSVLRANTPRTVTRVNTPRTVARVNTPRTVTRVNTPRPLPTTTNRPLVDESDSLSFSVPSFSQSSQRQRPSVAASRPVAPQSSATFQVNPTSIDFDAEVQRLSGSLPARRPQPEASQRRPPPAAIPRPIFDDDEEPDFNPVQINRTERPDDQESERSSESVTAVPVRSTTPFDFSSFGPSAEQTQRLRQQLEQRRRIQEQEEEQQRRIQEQNRLEEERERIRQDNERRQQAIPQQPRPQQPTPQQFREPQQFPGFQQFGPPQFRPQQFERQEQDRAQQSDDNVRPPPPFNPNFAFNPNSDPRRQQFGFGGQPIAFNQRFAPQQLLQDGRQQTFNPPQTPSLPPPQSAPVRSQPVTRRPVSVNGESFAKGQIDSFLKSVGA